MERARASKITVSPETAEKGKISWIDAMLKELL
jgi:hypothetical protein